MTTEENQGQEGRNNEVPRHPIGSGIQETRNVEFGSRRKRKK
jgi:hypothetical protein